LLTTCLYALVVDATIEAALVTWWD